MAKETRIIPVMVNDDGTMSFHMEREGEKRMGFVNLASNGPGIGEDATASLLAKGILSGNQEVRVQRLPATDNDQPDYVLVAGNRDAFTPPTSLSEGRWVGPKEFEFGPLPKDSLDVSELGSVYTGSLKTVDHAALMIGIEIVRTLRHPECLPVISSPAMLAAALQSPEAHELIFARPVDKELPPLHLPPVVFAPSNRSLTRRGLLSAASALSKLHMLPKGTAESAAKRLLKSGTQPKPV